MSTLQEQRAQRESTASSVSTLSTKLEISGQWSMKVDMGPHTKKTRDDTRVYMNKYKGHQGTGKDNTNGQRR